MLKILHILRKNALHLNLNQDITFDGERNVTKLPFKPDHDSSPDNF